MRPMPDHNIVLRHLGHQAGESASRELAVAVTEHDPRLSAGLDA